MISDIYSRFTLNLKRCDNLLRIYEETKETGRGRKDVPSLDVLRAATVFLHATLEDFLRSLIVWRLPSLEAEVLDEVPLAGLGGSGRPEKFFLGKLALFRGQLVEEVIEQSVEDHAGSLSFNTTGDIAALLRKIGVKVEKVNSHFPELQQLMSRRHNIVHRADRNVKLGPGQHAALSIGAHTVARWKRTLRRFVDAVCAELPPE